jgi:hypothetical protein
LAASGHCLGGEQKRCADRSAPGWAWTHVAPGPLLEQGLGILRPRVLGPGCGWSRPYAEGFGTRPRGPFFMYRGLVLPPKWVRTHCVHLGVRLSPWPCGNLRAIHVAGQRVVPRATRDRCTGIASLYCSKGYPCFRVSIVAPGPPHERMRACRWGQNLYLA